MANAAAVKGEQEFLHIGDLVSLKDDLGGVVTSQGFSDTQVSLEPDDEGRQPIPREAIFLVRPQQNYSVERQLEKKLDMEGITRREAMADPQFRQLFDEREKEQKMNLSEFEQVQGREVRYGMVVQLQHVASEAYLMVARQAAEQNRDGRRVKIRPGSEACWWKLMPKLRVHSEGERVHFSDPVVWENVECGLQLTVGGLRRAAPGGSGSFASAEGSLQSLAEGSASVPCQSGSRRAPALASRALCLA